MGSGMVCKFRLCRLWMKSNQRKTTRHEFVSHHYIRTQAKTYFPHWPTNSHDGPAGHTHTHTHVVTFFRGIVVGQKRIEAATLVVRVRVCSIKWIPASCDDYPKKKTFSFWQGTKVNEKWVDDGWRLLHHVLLFLSALGEMSVTIIRVTHEEKSGLRHV